MKSRSKSEISKEFMQNAKHVMRTAVGFSVMALALTLMVGCKSQDSGKTASSKASTSSAPAPTAPPKAPTTTASAPKVAPTPAPTPTPAPPPAAPVARPTIRIKTGVTAPFTDSEGNVWMADTGFKDGETTERDAAMSIANTKDPGIYRSERYSMTSFSYPLPNGKYTVKLHFAETYEGITGPKDRVFSFNVEGQDFKDFDVWVKAGGGQRAYVQSVDVDITDGKLDITFTSNVENPEINGIEIIPQS
jgi:hypothetical protein